MREGQPFAAAIAAVVHATPGISLNELRKELGFPSWGTLLGEIQTLVMGESILKREDSRGTRLFPPPDQGPLRPIDALRDLDEFTRGFARRLSTMGAGIHLECIAHSMSITEGTAMVALASLLEAGALHVDISEGAPRYRVDPSLVELLGESP